jgi:hypothetical protein
MHGGIPDMNGGNWEVGAAHVTLAIITGFAVIGIDFDPFGPMMRDS